MLKKTCLILIGSLFVIALFSTVFAKPRRISSGTWGGDQVSLTVTNNTATINYSCAEGTIDGPLTVDSKGRFRLTGSHRAQHGGPVRMDENGSGRPAVYSGTIKGKVMHLNVKLTDANETVGDFVLVLGRPGKLVRCM